MLVLSIARSHIAPVEGISEKIRDWNWRNLFFRDNSIYRIPIRNSVRHSGSSLRCCRPSKHSSPLQWPQGLDCFGSEVISNKSSNLVDDLYGVAKRQTSTHIMSSLQGQFQLTHNSPKGGKASLCAELLKLWIWIVLLWL